MTKPFARSESRLLAEATQPGGPGTADRAEYIAALATELAALADTPDLRGVRACLYLAVDEARRAARL